MQLRNATILLVDDEPDMPVIMGEWFRLEGCRVLSAENGAEALNVIRENHVDAIVSDIRMPVMDGITMLKNIKAAKRYRPSVMFISGFSDIEPRDAYDLGVEAMMSKPLERKALLSTVTRILAERAELWGQPPGHKAQAVLDAAFDSLATAMSQRLLAFGRGGFCIHSTLKLREGLVDLLLDFQADQRRVTGQGIVRSTAPSEAQLGVEIMSLDDNSRTSILSLAEPNNSLSFIPRTTAITTPPAAIPRK
jgi:CheY-like chemotaxis protein